ncbi:MAG: DUF2779 domain-containing protein [Bdellovibrionales bacterium]|nr:DUF2779 domain-containing protein [Bdellovibrionales bacterium]
MAHRKSLSKSRYLLGLQCPKALFLAVHSPELAGPVSASAQKSFDQGHAVGLEAQKRYPGGVLIGASHSHSKLALAETRAAIEAGAPAIFEATLAHKGVLVKVDVLEHAGGNDWNLVEVKSSTGVKQVHLHDVALQLWVLRGAGLKVKRAFVLHINNQCRHPHLEELFERVDVTAKVEAMLPAVGPEVAEFLELLQRETAPEVDIGPHCKDPYPCAYRAHCWGPKKIPSPSVFDIPGWTAQKKWAAYRAGAVSLDRLDRAGLSPAQRRMVEHSVSGKRYVNAKGIRQAMRDWEYPYSFLDFETLDHPIPKFMGVRAYEQLPFQWSCLVQRAPCAEFERHEYLHADATDPREPLARALVEALPEKGSVIAYNASFERGVLTSLAEEFPNYRKSLKGAAARLVDPYLVVRAHVYDPAFLGRLSVKAVAPALLGLGAGYKGMAVGEGAEAQLAYLEMIAPGIPPERRAELKRALLDYCRKDTEAMAGVVEWLSSVG